MDENSLSPPQVQPANEQQNKVVIILLPVLLALIVSALVGLQLFQDGSSYLLELLISRSAVRHDRVTILLFQMPSIFLIQAINRLQIDALTALPIVRFLFSLNYAITPFLSLMLSWLVVRKKEEKLFIWAALIILFINLVNFSWVSELLISLQLTCPLLLALLQNPRSKTFWGLFFLLTPVIFFLHPLVIAFFLVLASVSAYIAYKIAAYRSSARLITVLFLFAAGFRGLYTFFTLDPYERSFLAAGETRDYLILASLENVLFLLIAVEIALIVLLSRSIIESRRLVSKFFPWFISLQSLALLLLTTRFFLKENLSPVVLASCFGLAAILHYRQPQNSSAAGKMRWYYISCGIMAALASILLLAQYILYQESFRLKIGPALFAALLIMILAAFDRTHSPLLHELTWRFRLAGVLSVVFAGVILAKSLMWQASVYKLEQTVGRSEAACVELSPSDFQWLEKAPYTIINNWSLPSLSLVLQDRRPRKLLLEQYDCRLFYQSGVVQIDPWSRIEKQHIVPPLE